MCATWVSQIIGAVPGIQHGESRVTTVGPYSPNVAMSIDCCNDRIVGLSVYIKLDENIITSCGSIQTITQKYELDCDGKGNVVELSAEGKIGQQNIAEIEVYGITGGIYISHFSIFFHETFRIALE